MYLKNLYIKNLGPIDELNLEFPFFDDDSPKPIVFVGHNGSGKTVVLSSIVDALQEIQYKADVRDVQIAGVTGHKYFRPLGARNLKTDKPYYLSALKFTNNTDSIVYIDKYGTISKSDFDSETKNIFNITWPNKTAINAFKVIDAPNVENMYDIFDKGAYFYFPAYRYEEPFWKNNDIQNKSTGTFFHQLEKPIELVSVLSENLIWLNDVVADQDLVYASINSFLVNILEKENIFLGRFDRSKAGMNRITIAREDHTPYLPLLSNLSLGELTLFNLVLTIFRYTDIGRDRRDISEKNLNDKLREVKGIVVIDEIENHLHSKLIVNLLPKIIKSFPSIQFILTSHSPLFLLGMENIFGENNFKIMNLPSGTEISPEDFSEFQEIFTTISKTNTFQKIIKESPKPVIITEGKTDPKILEEAWKHLYPNKEIPYAFYGLTDDNGKASGAKALMDLIHKIPNLGKKVLALFDYDNEGFGQWNGLKKKGFLPRAILNETVLVRENNIYASYLPVPSSKTIYKERLLFEIENYFPDSKIVACSEEDFYCLKSDSSHQGQRVLKFLKNQKNTFAENTIKSFSDTDFSEFDLLFRHLEQCFKP